MSPKGHSPSTLPDDDWLDAALAADAREHGSSYLDDRGFTARVMAALPAPVAARCFAESICLRSIITRSGFSLSSFSALVDLSPPGYPLCR